MSVDDFRMRHATFLDACTDAGRDPADITVSTLLRYDGDVDATARQAEEYGEAGIDLGMVSLPKSHDPAALETIAAALEPLAD